MLSPYSSEALATLQRLLPDLVALAIEKEDYFIISTTSPSGFELWISSAGRELTVGFAEHHTHFGWHEGDPQEDAIEAAGYVQELRTGALEVIARYEGAAFAGSMAWEGDQPPVPLTWFQRWWRRKQHQVVRRWSE